jgi:hypothetical protein
VFFVAEKVRVVECGVAVRRVIGPVDMVGVLMGPALLLSGLAGFRAELCPSALYVG